MQFPRLSITALELPISAGHYPLRNVLRDLHLSKLVTLPVSIVTPSASSWSVVDWMKHVDDSSENSTGPAFHYIDTWIPVAPVALTLATDHQISATLLNRQTGRKKKGTTGVVVPAIQVLSIYGDHDHGGAVLSRRLKSLVNATLVEIPGGHACYRKSPRKFVNAIDKFFGLKRAK